MSLSIGVCDDGTISFDSGCPSPSTAVNQLEMWQAETFDSTTIDRELGWAAGIGMNVVSVYLHNLPWEADSAGFRLRTDRFLQMADRHRIRVLFVLLDDCWNPHPHAGSQPAPLHGVHNSGWVQCPGREAVLDSSQWPRIERFVKDVLRNFSDDRRVLMWDLYNEPGNSNQGLKSLPLLQKVFRWAREVGPGQPLTAGVYEGTEKQLADFQLEASDITTFHNYSDTTRLIQDITRTRAFGRPVICTEWMARTNNSRIETHLPIFKREKVGCINWGLVYGKTQTIYPWGSKLGSPEPKVWFHDLFRPDGTPFDEGEIRLLRAMTEQVLK